MLLACDHCDAEFEAVEGGDAPRCPKCLRRHGVRATADPAGDDVRVGAIGAIGAAKGHVWLFAMVGAAVAGVAYLASIGPGALGGKPPGGMPKDPVEAAVARAQNIVNLAAAMDALNAGDLKAAYNQADAVLEQEPKNPAAREVMGDTLLKSGAAPEGLKEFEAALAIEATGGRHYKAGKALVAMADPMAAAQHFKEALKLEPGAAWVDEVSKLLAEVGEALAADQGGPGDTGSAGGAAGGAPAPP